MDALGNRALFGVAAAALVVGAAVLTLARRHGVEAARHAAGGA
jgi:hypothetical protein